MSTLNKLFATFLLSVGSMSAFAGGNCDGSEMVIVNNTSLPLKIDSIHLTSAGTLENISEGQVLLPNQRALGVARAFVGSEISGVINFSNEDGRIMLSYSFEAEMFGFGECKATLDPVIRYFADDAFSTSQYVFNGEPAFVSFEVN